MSDLKTELDAAAGRVAQGAALFDRSHPGWRTHAKIDHDMLTIANGCHCMIAQLYGSYGANITSFMAVFAPFQTPVGIGVKAPHFENTHHASIYYAELTRCWLQILGHPPDQLTLGLSEAVGYDEDWGRKQKPAFDVFDLLSGHQSASSETGVRSPELIEA